MREVSFEEGQALASACNGVYFETSLHRADVFKDIMTIILNDEAVSYLVKF